MVNDLANPEPDEGLVIIDDPQVDLDEAEARRIQAAVNDWWASTAPVRQACQVEGLPAVMS